MKLNHPAGRTVRAGAVSSMEEALDKKVLVVLPFRRVMSVAIHMPHVGNAVLFRLPPQDFGGATRF